MQTKNRRQEKARNKKNMKQLQIRQLNIILSTIILSVNYQNIPLKTEQLYITAHPLNPSISEAKMDRDL